MAPAAASWRGFHWLLGKLIGAKMQALAGQCKGRGNSGHLYCTNRCQVSTLVVSLIFISTSHLDNSPDSINLNLAWPGA